MRTPPVAKHLDIGGEARDLDVSPSIVESDCFASDWNVCSSAAAAERRSGPPHAPATTAAIAVITARVLGI